jgi:hypothetical protein
MKYKGKKLEGRNSDILVFIKNGERIIIKAEALENYKEFDDLVSIPKAPILMRPGGIKEENRNDPSYKIALDLFQQKRVQYLVIKSLQATKDLEWEKVKLSEPDSWSKYEEELRETFSEIEVSRIIQLINRVNSLDDDMLEEARQNFLQEAQQVES